MLYATRLAKDMVLALIFDAETPFSTIRTQANQLVHSLSTLPADKPADEDRRKMKRLPLPSRISFRISLPQSANIEPVSPQRGWKRTQLVSPVFREIPAFQP